MREKITIVVAEDKRPRLTQTLHTGNDFAVGTLRKRRPDKIARNDNQIRFFITDGTFHKLHGFVQKTGVPAIGKMHIGELQNFEPAVCRKNQTLFRKAASIHGRLLS